MVELNLFEAYGRKKNSIWDGGIICEEAEARRKVALCLRDFSAWSQGAAAAGAQPSAGKTQGKPPLCLLTQ